MTRPRARSASWSPSCSSASRAIQARRDLRRFKQLLETGEVTVNASPSARKSESPTEARI